MRLRTIEWKAAAFLAVLLCLWGGIYDFSAAAYGLVFAAGIVVLACRRRIRVPFNITTCALLVLLLGSVFSVFVAADRGMAAIGAVRMTVPFIFWIFWCRLEEGTRETIWKILPGTVTILTGGALLLYLVPAARPYLYRADRLGGVFQYSNTYALLLLAALLIHIDKKATWRWKEYVSAGILLCGILFCGSRSVLVLGVAAALIYAASRRTEWKQWNWKHIFAFFAIAAATAAMMQMIFRLDLGRLSALTLESSTLNGRFLYWQDALPQILRHPLGLGYMGYYYLQPQFQTGNYVVRFVHNDILQMGLDAGILPMAALTALFAAGIFRKRCPAARRLVLVILFLHSLFDLDLQYMSMFCLMLMCMDTEGKRDWCFTGKKALAGAGLLTVFFLYFTAAMGLSQAGMNRESLAMYPGYTDGALALMEETQDAEIAEELIRRNGMLAAAYDCAADAHAEVGEYRETYEDVCGMLNCAGYDMYYYNQSVYYLSFALNAALEADDTDGGQKILEKIQEIPAVLQGLEDRTSNLAWRINDRPEFELEESVKAYLESLSGISLK